MNKYEESDHVIDGKDDEDIHGRADLPSHDHPLWVDEEHGAKAEDDKKGDIGILSKTTQEHGTKVDDDGIKMILVLRQKMSHLYPDPSLITPYALAMCPALRRPNWLFDKIADVDKYSRRISTNMFCPSKCDRQPVFHKGECKSLPTSLAPVQAQVRWHHHST